jgi:hypothetical protein
MSRRKWRITAVVRMLPLSVVLLYMLYDMIINTPKILLIAFGLLAAGALFFWGWIDFWIPPNDKDESE